MKNFAEKIKKQFQLKNNAENKSEDLDLIFASPTEFVMKLDIISTMPEIQEFQKEFDEKNSKEEKTLSQDGMPLLPPENKQEEKNLENEDLKVIKGLATTLSLTDTTFDAAFLEKKGMDKLLSILKSYNDAFEDVKETEKKMHVFIETLKCVSHIIQKNKEEFEFSNFIKEVCICLYHTPKTDQKGVMFNEHCDLIKMCLSVLIQMSKNKNANLVVQGLFERQKEKNLEYLIKVVIDFLKSKNRDKLGITLKIISLINLLIEESNYKSILFKEIVSLKISHHIKKIRNKLYKIIEKSSKSGGNQKQNVRVVKEISKLLESINQFKSGTLVFKNEKKLKENEEDKDKENKKEKYSKIARETFEKLMKAFENNENQINGFKELLLGISQKEEDKQLENIEDFQIMLKRNDEKDEELKELKKKERLTMEIFEELEKEEFELEKEPSTSSDDEKESPNFSDDEKELQTKEDEKESLTLLDEEKGIPDSLEEEKELTPSDEEKKE